MDNSFILVLYAQHTLSLLPRLLLMEAHWLLILAVQEQISHFLTSSAEHFISHSRDNRTLFKGTSAELEIYNLTQLPGQWDQNSVITHAHLHPGQNSSNIFQHRPSPNTKNPISEKKKKYNIHLALTMQEWSKATLWSLIMGVWVISPSFFTPELVKLSSKTLKTNYRLPFLTPATIQWTLKVTSSPTVGSRTTGLGYDLRCLRRSPRCRVRPGMQHLALPSLKCCWWGKYYAAGGVFEKSDAPVKNISSDMEVKAWAILPPAGLGQAYILCVNL